MTAWIAALIGSVITLTAFIVTVAFRAGQHDSRLAALEKWRDSIRADMHEISDKIEELTTSHRHLATLIEERTDRRLGPRAPTG